MISIYFYISMKLLWSYELIWLNCSISYYNWALKSDQINQMERTKKENTMNMLRAMYMARYSKTLFIPFLSK